MELITELKENEVFVFGSNLSGRHGKGAAKQALEFGAIYGQSIGMQGQTYAIPTKSYDVRVTLDIDFIKMFVDDFINYAIENKNKTFLVTEIGCGLAGLTPKQVAPLFKNALNISNIKLPTRFIEQLTIQ